jgi:hypothetical protein
MRVRLWASPDVHVHDLRHTGNTLASQTGATLKELMQQMGHSTVRAAMIYQQAAEGRDQKIAEALDELIDRLRAERETGESDQQEGREDSASDWSGTELAREPRTAIKVWGSRVFLGPLSCG